MEFDTTIEQILKDDGRIWEQHRWFELTVSFICAELQSHCDYHQGMSTDYVSLRDRLMHLDTSLEYRIVDILYRMGEYSLLERYLSGLEPLPHLHFLRAKLLIEKHEFRSANEYFLRGYQYLARHFTCLERIEYFIEWCFLFVESKHFDLVETLSERISQYISVKNGSLYTRSLYLLFIVNKAQHHIEAASSYAGLLIANHIDFLDSSSLYMLHLFSGEYYASMNKNFDKSIQHYTSANTCLANKWKEYIAMTKSLQEMVLAEDLQNLQVNSEHKMRKILLETNLHNGYYINALKKAYLELQKIHSDYHSYAFTDSLTGLYNRRYLWDNVDEFMSLAKAENLPIACFMIDFDDFKTINDKYGHIAGDKVLQTTCQAIQEFFRKSDIVVRFGGEEILVLLYNINSQDAYKLAEKLLYLVDNLKINLEHDTVIKVSVSIGVSATENTSQSDSHILENMINEADQEMYREKAKKKN